MRGVLRRVGVSPSMVVAFIALLVALGGTSYAALKLPRNSVGAKQIKKNAVTSSKVKSRSLRLSDLSTSARNALKGERGPQGPPGERGPQGIAGTGGSGGGSTPILFYRTEPGSVGFEAKASKLASCQAGEHVTGGGADATTGDTAVVESYPKPDGTGWWVTVENNNTSGSYTFTVYAICTQSNVG